MYLVLASAVVFLCLAVAIALRNKSEARRNYSLYLKEASALKSEVYARKSAEARYQCLHGVIMRTHKKISKRKNDVKI